MAEVAVANGIGERIERRNQLVQQLLQRGLRIWSIGQVANSVDVGEMQSGVGLNEQTSLGISVGRRAAGQPIHLPFQTFEHVAHRARVGFVEEQQVKNRFGVQLASVASPIGRKVIGGGEHHLP